MDGQDVAILRELARDPRASYGAIGARVLLSANAVKARLRKMEDDGVLQGYATQPHPALLGAEEGILSFDGVHDLAEREDELLANLPEVPGVLLVEVGIEDVHVHALAADAADWERIERAAVSLVGKPPARSSRHALGRSDPDMSPSDWRIARALLADGRLGLKELCAATGISFKTVKRRLARLLDEGMLRIEPFLSPAEASGCVLHTIIVHLREGATTAPLLAALPHAIASRARDSRVVHVHAAAPTLRAARRHLRALQALEGVEDARLHVATRRRGVAWLDEKMGARMAAAIAPPAPAPSAPVLAPTVRNG